MNCDAVRRHWELFYDSEGDSELYLQINEHLAECPDCAKWFFQQGQVEALVTAKLAAATATPETWRRVLSGVGIAQPAPARSWMIFSSCLAVAASLLLAVTLWHFSRGADAGHLSALTAAAHQTLADGARRIEFVSRSDLAVERYLKERVPFAVRCPPREDAGFEVRGGGICSIAGDPAAYVVGRVEGKEVSVFILPEERLAEFAHERAVIDREEIHHCREGQLDMVLAKIDRNVVVVIGSASPQRLERVVRAYGTYPEPAGAARSPVKPDDAPRITA